MRKGRGGVRVLDGLPSPSIGCDGSGRFEWTTIVCRFTWSLIVRGSSWGRAMMRWRIITISPLSPLSSISPFSSISSLSSISWGWRWMMMMIVPLSSMGRRGGSVVVVIAAIICIKYFERILKCIIQTLQNWPLVNHRNSTPPFNSNLAQIEFTLLTSFDHDIIA